MRELTFTLPFTLAGTNVMLRQHWSERARIHAGLQREILAAVGGPRHFPRPPFERARVTIVRVSVGQLDQDNATASVKGLLDVLKARTAMNPLGLSIIARDDPDHLELVVQQQRAASLADQCTIVRIEELPAAPLAEPPRKPRPQHHAVRPSRAGLNALARARKGGVFV